MSLKIGFIPTHRNLMDEEYAISMKRIFEEKMKSHPQIELVVPGNNLTNGGLVRDENDAKKILKLFDEKKPQAILIGAITYGDEKSVFSIVEDYCNIPIFLFAVKDPEVPDNEYFKSAASCGAMPISYGLHKRNIKFTFGGIVDVVDSKFDKNLDKFIRVSKAFRKFRNARIGMIGSRPNTFEVCAVNEGLMLEKYRQKVIHINLLDLKNQLNEITDDNKEVKKITREIISGTESVYSEKDLAKIAKLEILMLKYARELNLDVMTIQYWSSIQQYIGITPCLTNGRVTNFGIPVACEGDIHGAISMLIQRELTLLEKTPSFLDILMQHPTEENLFLAWHCGNPSIINKNPSSKAKVLPQCPLEEIFDKKSAAATMEFMLKPGIITVNRIVEHNGIFKMLNIIGKMVERKDNLRGGWSWVEVKDRVKLYETIFN